ncbi:MAG: hypothetical protein Q4D37_05970 [Oscillospiraceae bacterium]|nr:hypothetical protein [Oscillospiraceae bacterium]
MNLLVNNEANECVALLINALPACQFKQFIECVNRKENWTAELCWCFFEKSDDNKEYYHLQTFENDSYIIHYNDFLDIVKLAIVRFYLGTDDVKIKESLKEYIKNTVFDSVLDHIDSSLASGVPLVYGQ